MSDTGVKAFCVGLAATILAGLISTTASAGARFEQFPASPYTGAVHRPDFSGPGRRYRQMRTVIAEGFTSGRRFGGHYVLISTGCGAGCRIAYVGDLATGRIYEFPLGGEANYGLEVQVRPDSRVVKAHWNDFDTMDRQCHTQDFIWNDRSFRQLPVEVVPQRCPEWY